MITACMHERPSARRMKNSYSNHSNFITVAELIRKRQKTQAPSPLTQYSDKTHVSAL